MKNKNNIYISTTSVKIFYIGTQYYPTENNGLVYKHGEFSCFVYAFPIKKKDLKSEAIKELTNRNIRFEKVTKVEYTTANNKTITIKF